MRTAAWILVGVCACTQRSNGGDTDAMIASTSDAGAAGSSEAETTASQGTTVDGPVDTGTGAPADASSSGGVTGNADTTTTGADAGSGGEGGSAECTALMACCDQLGADVYGGCVQVVDLAMPGLCDSTLSTYHQQGYCTGESFCADLAACCPELPPGQGWQDTCTYYADLGNQPQCAMLIGDYQLSGYCM